MESFVIFSLIIRASKKSLHTEGFEHEKKRSLTLIMDYNLTIQYNPERANVVADALSSKSVPPTSDCLVANFGHMDISYCFVSVAN
jgi:hypothetical protein